MATGQHVRRLASSRLIHSNTLSIHPKRSAIAAAMRNAVPNSIKTEFSTKVRKKKYLEVNPELITRKKAAFEEMLIIQKKMKITIFYLDST